MPGWDRILRQVEEGHTQAARKSFSKKKELEFYHRLEKADPRFAGPALALARIYDDFGDFRKAEEYFQKAFQRSGHPLPVTWSYLTFLQRRGEWEKGIPFLEEHENTLGKERSAFWRAVFLEAVDPNRAFSVWQKLAERGDPPFLLRAGTLALAQGEYEKAKKQAEIYRRLRPHDLQGFVLQQNVFFFQNDFEAMWKEFQSALPTHSLCTLFDETPQSFWTWCRLSGKNLSLFSKCAAYGLWLGEQELREDQVKANRIFEKAWKISSGHPGWGSLSSRTWVRRWWMRRESVEKIQHALEKGEKKKVLEYLALVSLSPTQPKERLVLEKLLEASSKEEAFLAYFQERRQEGEEEDLVFFARALFESGKKSEALQLLKEGAETSFSDTRWALIAEWEKNRGNIEAALSAWREAQLRNFKEPYTAQEGEALWLLGEKEKAMELWKEALLRDPCNSVLWENRTKAAWALGRKKEALEAALGWMTAAPDHEAPYLVWVSLTGGGEPKALLKILKNEKR